jgi:hypothetical protein
MVRECQRFFADNSTTMSLAEMGERLQTTFMISHSESEILMGLLML